MRRPLPVAWRGVAWRGAARPGALAASALAAGALLAACGSNAAAPATTSTAAATTSSAPATTTSAPATTTSLPVASSTTSTLVPVNGNVASCTTASLALALGSSSGSAGAVDIALVFTNTGTLPCVLYGYPGVSATTSAAGAQIGLAAERATQLGPPSVVTLAPGAKANADLHVAVAGNYPTAACQMVTAGLRVYPPGETHAAFVPASLQVCSKDVPGQLFVGPVVPGAASSVNGG